MSAIWPTLPRMPANRRRLGFAGGASKLLGTPVAAVVPVQRHNPAVVLGVSLIEVGALVVLIVTGNLAAMFTLVGTSVVLVGVMVTNARRLIALTEKGNVTMSASIRGWPTGVIAPAPRHLHLPEPAGLGVRLDIQGTPWWVDRSAYRFLRQARAVESASLQSDGQHDRRE